MDLDANWWADRGAMVVRIWKLVHKARSTRALGNRAEADAFFAKATPALSQVRDPASPGRVDCAGAPQEINVDVGAEQQAALGAV